MNAPNNAVATQQPRTLDQAVQQFGNQLTERANDLKMVLPSHISPERFQRTILTGVTSDPDLLRADRRSLITACMKAAQDGLLPDKREAAIVVFENSYNIDGEWRKVKEAQYMPMVYGLRKKILQSGEITSLTTQVVYRCEEAEGRFIYEEGTEAMLRHKPKLDMTEEEAADDNIIAAYSMVTFKDGSKSYEVLPRRELNKIQRASKTGSPVDRKGKPREVKGPWKDWYSEMCRKSAMRRHSKTLPMSGDLLDTLNAGFDDGGAGESVAGALSIAQPDEPVRLPSNEELDGQQAQEGYNQATGELSDDERREIDEQLDRETERQLAGDDQVNDDPSPQPKGDNDVAESLGDDQNDGGIDWDAKQAEIVNALAEKKTVPDVNSYWTSAEIEGLLNMAPDYVAGQLEAAKRKRISEIKG